VGRARLRRQAATGEAVAGRRAAAGVARGPDAAFPARACAELALLSFATDELAVATARDLGAARLALVRAIGRSTRAVDAVERRAARGRLVARFTHRGTSVYPPAPVDFAGESLAAIAVDGARVVEPAAGAVTAAGRAGLIHATSAAAGQVDEAVLACRRAGAGPVAAAGERAAVLVGRAGGVGPAAVLAR